MSAVPPFDTILLDVTTWDYVADAAGNWAKASPPYSLAQDVSSACRLIQSELWYDISQGVPFLNLNGGAGGPNTDANILGETPPLSVVQEYFVQAALTVPGVVSAVCVIETFSAVTRQVVGQVQFTDSNGNTGIVSI
jgi:hypothetical protein